VDGELLIREILEPIAEGIPLANFRDRNWIFAWDGAGCHVGKKIQQWMRQNFPDFIDKDSWPPSSPDIMPNDYFLNRALEDRIKPRSRRTEKFFRAALLREWQKMPMESIRAAIDALPKRLQRCCSRKGDYFEHSIRKQ
jgi:hypothetical protein